MDYFWNTRIKRTEVPFSNNLFLQKVAFAYALHTWRRPTVIASSGILIHSPGPALFPRTLHGHSFQLLQSIYLDDVGKIKLLSQWHWIELDWIGFERGWLWMGRFLFCVSSSSKWMWNAVIPIFFPRHFNEFWSVLSFRFILFYFVLSALRGSFFGTFLFDKILLYFLYVVVVVSTAMAQAKSIDAKYWLFMYAIDLSPPHFPLCLPWWSNDDERDEDEETLFLSYKDPNHLQMHENAERSHLTPAASHNYSY